jgi:prepilin signal peptidase PulO-like enzyme (type II secretory pathway)
MNINPFIILYGISGLVLGFLIPPITSRMIRYKCERRNIAIKKSRLDERWFQLIICIVNGILWTVTALRLAPVPSLLCSLLFTLAIVFTVIDIRIHTIPNELLAVTLAVGILFQLFRFGSKSLLTASLCMLILAVLYLLLGFILGLDKIGAGDVKLAGVMGMVLGYPAIVTAILFMSISIILYCVIGIWTKKLTLISMFPFAPFMMFGMSVALCGILF